MDAIFQTLDPVQIALVLAIAVFAGAVKGIVGFALPTILVSAFSQFLSAELALAALILPTLVTNGLQALRQGFAAAVTSVRRFKVFLGAGLVCLFGSAQLFRVLPGETLYLVLGIAVAGFAAMQLAGVTFRLAGPNKRIEAGVGAFAGFIGGLTGVWGPPTVAYLTAINTEKSEHMRVQGVIYGLGALALMIAHIGSGVFNTTTAPLSVALVIPCLIGMWFGGKVHDRIDQAMFRRAILIVLLLAGLNLIRKALF